MTLDLLAANLNPFPVGHSWMEFAVCCKCFSMVCRGRPWKQIVMSATTSILKMPLAIRDGISSIFTKYFTARSLPVGTPSSGQKSSDNVVTILPRIQRSLRYSVTKTWSLTPCAGRGYHNVSLFHKPFLGQRKDQLPVGSETGILGETYRSVSCLLMLRRLAFQMHQQAWYWINDTGMSLTLTRKAYINFCQLSDGIW